MFDFKVFITPDNFKIENIIRGNASVDMYDVDEIVIKKLKRLIQYIQLEQSEPAAPADNEL